MSMKIIKRYKKTISFVGNVSNKDKRISKDPFFSQVWKCKNKKGFTSHELIEQFFHTGLR